MSVEQKVNVFFLHGRLFSKCVLPARLSISKCVVSAVTFVHGKSVELSRKSVQWMFPVIFALFWIKTHSFGFDVCSVMLFFGSYVCPANVFFRFRFLFSKGGHSDPTSLQYRLWCLFSKCALPRHPIISTTKKSRATSLLWSVCLLQEKNIEQVRLLHGGIFVFCFNNFYV